MEANKVIIADDHPLFRGALIQALAQFIPGVEAITAASLESLRTSVAAHPDADLVFLDLLLPDCQGFAGLAQLRSEHPALPVVVISASEGPDVVRRALDYGAAGYIPKSASMPTLAEATHAVLRGEIWFPADVMGSDGRAPQPPAGAAAQLATLTPQQLRVLQMLRDGRPNKQIAFELEVSEATVKAHVTAILRKLNVHNRTQAVIVAGDMDLGEARPDASA